MRPGECEKADNRALNHLQGPAGEQEEAGGCKALQGHTHQLTLLEPRKGEIALSLKMWVLLVPHFWEPAVEQTHT